jgi:hypothetical protein
MPMKCIDQIPAPIAPLPASSHSAALRRESATDTRAAMSSAVYDARMATRTESTTNNGL